MSSISFKLKKLIFLSTLEVEVLDDKEYRLTKAFWAKWGLDDIKVPEDYITDFASVPKIPIVYALVGEIGHKAAVLHDFGYTEGLYTKEEVDYYFYVALRNSGVGWFKAQLMWLGVRLGGRSHGKRY